MRLSVTTGVTSACDDLCDVPRFQGDLVARLREAMPQGDQLEQTPFLPAARAARTPPRVLHALGSGEGLCACDLAHGLGRSALAASPHLRELRDPKTTSYRNDAWLACGSLRHRFDTELVQRTLQQEMP